MDAPTVTARVAPSGGTQADQTLTVNPRIRSTKGRVRAVARTLLAERGPIGLTYTAVAAASGVTRQTLYRHWPTRELLFAELVTTAPRAAYPAPSADASELVTGFLYSLRADLCDVPTAMCLMSLAAHAPVDPVSAAALVGVTEECRLGLNILLAATGRRVDGVEFSRLVGPVLYQCLIAQVPVTQSQIEEIVADWLARLPGAPA